MNLSPSEWKIIESALLDHTVRTLEMAEKEEDDFYASLHDDYAQRVRELLFKIREGAA